MGLNTPEFVQIEIPVMYTEQWDVDWAVLSLEKLSALPLAEGTNNMHRPCRDA